MLLLGDNYKIVEDHYETGDIIFNGLHGGYGENGEIQSFFEDRGINFIGSKSILVINHEVNHLLKF